MTSPDYFDHMRVCVRCGRIDIIENMHVIEKYQIIHYRHADCSSQIDSIRKTIRKKSRFKSRFNWLKEGF